MAATIRCMALILVLSTACAHQQSGTVTDSDPSAPRASRNSNVISQEELVDPTISGLNALTAIRQLRPSFFMMRGPQSFGNETAGLVKLSQDYGPLIEVQQLANFTPRDFIEVRYLPPNDAANRFGLNANGGPVIVLITSKSVQ